MRKNRAPLPPPNRTWIPTSYVGYRKDKRVKLTITNDRKEAMPDEVYYVGMLFPNIVAMLHEHGLLGSFRLTPDAPVPAIQEALINDILDYVLYSCGVHEKRLPKLRRFLHERLGG